MQEITTKNGIVKIYAKTYEEDCMEQVLKLAESPLGEDAHIRMMPDMHLGKSSPIGLTMKFTNKICPNVVSVDIGCGVVAYQLAQQNIDLEQLDKFCRTKVVSGQNVRSKAVNLKMQEGWLPDLYCWEALKNHDRLYKSLGTLGGGWR